MPNFITRPQLKLFDVGDEPVVLPKDDVSPQQYAKHNVSLPSSSVDDVNVPEVSDAKGEFVYNFYVKDERINPFSNADQRPLGKIARYVTLRWTSPRLSEFEATKDDIAQKARDASLSIERNGEKVVSEDNFFNPGFVNHAFSNVDAIEQGASDLETYSRMSMHDTESVFKMAKYQVKDIASKGKGTDFDRQLAELTDAYSRLADLPKSSLGLRVFDEKGRPSDEDDLISSIADSVTLHVKVNAAVIPDVFRNSRLKNDQVGLKVLQDSYSASQSGYKRKEGLHIVPVMNDSNSSSASYLTQPVKLIGYVVDRYVAGQAGFKKEKTFYIEDVATTHLDDRSVLYGVTYVYSIRAIASVKMLTYNNDGTRVDVSTIYVSSRPVSVPVECYEYVPPPEPNDIRFVFDYKARNLIIVWDTPVNHQVDVKQFQVFRRKSIKEPFELIAQYGFDRSEAGPGSGGRYRTGERVDANNVANMAPEDRYLVKDLDQAVFFHRDEDFTVDTEFFVSSAYIYAVCSVDAHGMISNYSSQHHVTFDPYKNRLSTKLVCDAGSPRQYPNMSLRMDAFKDVIKTSGDTARRVDVYFTPECLKVRDDRNVTYKVVEAQTTNSNPYYLLQMINLDNQKTQLLRINVKDPGGLTL